MNFRQRMKLLEPELVKGFNDLVSNLEKEVEEKNLEIDRLKNELFEVKGKYNSILDEHSKLKIQYKNECNRLNIRIAELESKVKTMKHTITKLTNKKNTKNPISSNEMRSINLPLNAKVNYDYGARVFTSKDFPDYVWRNDHWYILGTEFDVSCDKCDVSNIYEHKNIKVNDRFASVIVNNNRYFVYDVFEENNINKINYLWDPLTHIYYFHSDIEKKDIIIESYGVYK